MWLAWDCLLLDLESVSSSLDSCSSQGVESMIVGLVYPSVGSLIRLVGWLVGWLVGAVNRSMGIGGCMGADEKKKLLWGSKKEAVKEVGV